MDTLGPTFISCHIPNETGQAVPSTLLGYFFSMDFVLVSSTYSSGCLNLISQSFTFLFISQNCSLPHHPSPSLENQTSSFHPPEKSILALWLSLCRFPPNISKQRPPLFCLWKLCSSQKSSFSRFWQYISPAAQDHKEKHPAVLHLSTCSPSLLLSQLLSQPHTPSPPSTFAQTSPHPSP